MKSSFCIDLQRFMLIPTKFPLSPNFYMIQQRGVNTIKKGVTLMSNSFLLWCHQESNRGHKDFQSFALPTELWHQHCVA